MVASALVLAPAPAQGCGYSDERAGPDQALFDLGLLDDPDAPPFLYARYQAFADGNNGVPNFTEINLDDWERHFHKKLERGAWSQLLYKAPLSRVDGLIFALQGTRPPVAEDAPFLRYPDRPGLIAALYYVGFAKRVEPFATEKEGQSAWDARGTIDEDARDRALANLIDSGGRALDSAKVPFLRQRYALQVLRLHFYRGDSAGLLAFFKKHQRPSFADGSSVAWRALGYKAGLLHGAGRFAEANVLYATLFNRYPPMRHSALWSFHPQSERDWEDTLRSAKTRRDKATLWHMLGITRDGLRAMEAIYALDPKSKRLPLLLVREVVRAEVEGPATTADEATSSSPSHKARGPGGPDRQRELLDFLDKVAARGDAVQPVLWNLAAGHLHAMRSEPGAAKRFLDRAAAATGSTADERVTTQIRVSRFYALLQSLKAPSAADEARLATELDWTAFGVGSADAASNGRALLLDIAKGRLASLYGKRGDAFTATCLGNGEGAAIEDPAQIDGFVAFLSNPRKTAFQEVVAKMCPLTTESLTTMKGLLFAYRGDFDRGAAILASVKSDPLRGDPFAIRTRDCHSCDAADAEAHPGPRYTTAQFVTRLGALTREAASNPAKAARDYFEIANGLYNMTTYGSLRGLWPGQGIARDCTRAESYYRRAADAASDRELKAKATFMVAKCALNNAYNDPRRANDHRWFRSLRDTYADTQFYKDIIRECGYFRTFVNARASAPPRR